MSVPAPPSQHRPAKPSKASSAVPLAVLVVSAALAGGVAAAAPAGARSWTLGAVAGGWVCLALAVLTGTLLVRRAHRSAAQHLAESGTHQARSAQVSAETAHLVNITLPGLTKRLRDGASAADALTTVQPPSDPQLRQVMHTFAASLEEGYGRRPPPRPNASATGRRSTVPPPRPSG